MSKFFRSYSAVTALLLFFSFGYYFSGQINRVIKNENTCVCAYDGFGYYMYLPHLVQKGNLNMTQEWAQGLQNEYCQGIYAYQLVAAEKGQIDVYHMGQSFVEAPSFFVGHAFAKIFGYKTDGFSKPYHIAFLLNSLLFIGLGLIYCRKLFGLFFSDRLSALLIAITVVGTNYWITATLSNTMQHLYLFAIIAAFAYYFLKALQSETIHRKLFIVSAILFGLCVVIRPTNALLGVFPGIILLQRFGWKKEFWKYVVWFPVMAFIWNIPQIIYWKTIGDKWIITNLHTEDLTFFDPYTFKFLFSYRKGWLLYSPLFLLLVPAFWVIYKQRKFLFWPIFTFFIIFLWAVSSWECWWYSDSLGQRPMVDVYPILMIPIGFLLLSISKTWLKAAVGLFLVAVTSLNILQSWQMYRGYLSTSLMSKQHYWYIFGKTSFESFDNHRLLINRGDTSWVEQLQKIKDPQLALETKTWYYKENLTALPQSDLTVIHLPFKSLKTDEVRLTVDVWCSSSDTTQFSTLNLQAAGKHNCYSWDNVVLDPKSVDEPVLITKTFNIPDVRHKEDYLQIYVNNVSMATFNIKKIKITATSLIRK